MQVFVPLDGSRSAASAVPVAIALARAWHCQIILVGVHTQSSARRLRRTHMAVPDERQAVTAITAYLDDLAAMLRLQGLCVAVLIGQGDPSKEIFAATNAADHALIVMTTHGWTKDARVSLGHEAQHIVKCAAIPVLLICTDQDDPINPVAAIWDITVTLDGSDQAETTLRIASDLACALAVPLTLLRVIPNAFFLATMMQSPDESNYLLQDEMDDYHRSLEIRAAAYLNAIAAQVETPDLTVHTAITRSVTNRVSDGFVAYVAKRPHTLAVITRDERTGIAWWRQGEMLTSALAQMPHTVLIAPTTNVGRSRGGTAHTLVRMQFSAQTGRGMHDISNSHTKPVYPDVRPLHFLDESRNTLLRLSDGAPLPQREGGKI